MPTTHTVTHRTVAAVARDIKAAWPKPYFGAVPYLDAMLETHSTNDQFYDDLGSDIVNRFLINARTFRGPEARILKAELRAMPGVTA